MNQPHFRSLATAVVLALATAGADAQDRRADGRDEVVAALQDALSGDVLDAENLRGHLAEMRPLPAWSLLEVLAAAGIPHEWEAGARVVSLDPACLDAVRDVLLELPRADLLLILRTVAETEPSTALRLAAMDVLDAFATARDLRLLIELATPFEAGPGPLERGLRKRFEDALIGSLERDAGGFVVLTYAFDDAHPGLRNAIVSAVEEHPSSEALSTLATLLGATRDMDLLVLAAIARVAPGIPHPIDERVTQQVRGLLGSPRQDVVRSAARAAGSLEDYGALPALLDLLASEDPDVSAGAHRALQDLTRLGFRADRRQWSQWYERELAWWEVSSERLFTNLHSDDPVVVHAAVAELASHRLNRHELARELAGCLDRPEPEVVRLACEGLAQLGSPVAVSRLADCLENPDAGVRGASLSALRKITGKDLPADSLLWRERS